MSATICMEFLQYLKLKEGINSGHLCGCKVTSQASWHFASPLCIFTAKCSETSLKFDSTDSCLLSAAVPPSSHGSQLTRTNFLSISRQLKVLIDIIEFFSTVLPIHKIIIWFPCATRPVNQIWVQLDYVPQLRDWILTSLWALPIYTLAIFAFKFVSLPIKSNGPLYFAFHLARRFCGRYFLLDLKNSLRFLDFV